VSRRHIEELVGELRKRAETQAAMDDIFRPKAPPHATAVAAIVLYGEPKIEEPLVRAWAHTLRHHRITIQNEYGREYEYEPGHEHEYRAEYEYERELLIAYQQLYPAIMKDANETERVHRDISDVVARIHLDEVGCLLFEIRFARDVRQTGLGRGRAQGLPAMASASVGNDD
jgi:hypothetical protein